MRAYLKRLLQPLGSVELVADGKEALAAIERHLPDLVIADIMMPNLDGAELVRALRADQKTRTLPIIIVSARSGEESRIEGAKVGADEYISKPFSSRELFARVSAQLKLARQRNEYLRAILASEKKNEETALRNEELRKANIRKDEFLATLSHELRTPLTSVLMWTQMLLQKRVEPEKVDWAIRLIEKGALAQSQLIEDLLDVSRIVSGKLSLEIEDSDVNLLIHQAVDSLVPVASDKSIRINTSFAPEVGYAACDPKRIKQILWNLLSNAIKYSEVNSTIAVKSSLSDGNIKIEVTDSGRGINAEFLPFIFNRFSQEDSSITRKFGGLGLGLSIVHDLVALHGGTVTAESAGEGKGATFTVLLPKHRSKISAHSPAKEGSIANRLPNLAHRRILVVDDDVDSREVIQFALESMGAEVHFAKSAQEGLKRLQELRPDILLSDISMPDEDGITLIRNVRRLPKEVGGGIPAIAVTANASGEDARRVVEAGYQAHLSKPVELKKLENAISGLIRGAKSTATVN